MMRGGRTLFFYNSWLPMDRGSSGSNVRHLCEQKSKARAWLRGIHLSLDSPDNLSEMTGC